MYANKSSFQNLRMNIVVFVYLLTEHVACGMLDVKKNSCEKVTVHSISFLQQIVIYVNERNVLQGHNLKKYISY